MSQSNIIKLNSIDSFKIINPNLENEYDTLQQINTNNENNGNNFGEKNNIIDEGDIGLEISEDIKINTNTDPKIVYTILLDGIYDILTDNNQLFGNKNTNISKPDIKYENRKTFWYNYGKNCLQINRNTEQIKRFIEKEIAVKTSINDKSNLILRGKYSYPMIAGAYKKYIKNYVQCTTCKSMDTEIVRNPSNRLDYLKCLNPKCNTCKVVIKI
jgi:translation initiation factor 2 subunit 2